MPLESTVLDIALALLGAAVLLFAILGGAGLVLRIAESKYAKPAQDQALPAGTAPGPAVARADPDWDPILQLNRLTDLSDDHRVLRTLYELYPQDKSIEQVPDVPLMVDTSGAIRFNITAFCRFLEALAPRIRFAVQAVENPLELEHGPDREHFLRYVVAVLFYGGSVSYVLPDQNTIEDFADWKEETVAFALRDKIAADNESTAPRGVDFDSALQRLICLPAPSRRVFDYVQAFVRLNDPHHPPLGFVARQAHGKQQTTSLQSLPPSVARRNLRRLTQEIREAIEAIISRSPREAFNVMTMAQWLEATGMCKGKYVQHIQALLRDRGANEPDFEPPAAWSPSATLLRQNPFEVMPKTAATTDGKRAAQ